MPIRIPTKPPVATPKLASIPAFPPPVDTSVLESNERVLLAIRQAAEANARKVITATVERNKDGRIERIRMEVEPA